MKVNPFFMVTNVILQKTNEIYKFRYERIKELVELGYGLGTIGKYLGISKQRVDQILDEGKVKFEKGGENK